MGIKNCANATFSVQSKIFPKQKVKILQMRYQNVPDGLSYTIEREKKSEIFNLSYFHQSKMVTPLGATPETKF